MHGVIEAGWVTRGNWGNRSLDTCWLAEAHRNLTLSLPSKESKNCSGQRMYDHWRLKWFCGVCRHLITHLTMSCQSRRDTDSCDIFFCLKLFIFMVQNDYKHDDLYQKHCTGLQAKWQTLILFWTGLSGANIHIVLHFNDKNTIWKHQVAYWQ